MVLPGKTGQKANSAVPLQWVLPGLLLSDGSDLVWSSLRSVWFFHRRWNTSERYPERSPCGHPLPFAAAAGLALGLALFAHQLLLTLAAVVIGEAVVKHISPNFAVRLTGVLVGAVIYYLVYQVIIFVGFDTDLLKMFSALVVAVFLGVPYVKKQLARKHRVKGGIRHA